MKLLPAAYTLPEPIRPRRCPNCAHPDTQHDEDGCSCKALDYGCDGAGFLYPDPPDDWPDLTGYRVSSKWPHIPWETYCEISWQLVLGIVDTE